MGLKPLVAVLLLVSLLLAGCSGKKGDDDAESTSATSSSGPAPNQLPTAQLNVTVPVGALPLQVNFTLNGTDADGDALSWELDFGDNSTAANGTTLPTTFAHNYTAAGNFTAILTVSDGTGNATSNVTVAVAGSGGIPDPLHFEGTLTALPYIPQVGSPNDFVEGSSATHEFAFTGAPGTMTVTLVYGEGEFFNDVDLFITDPNGEETTSEEAGPEPPVVIENPAPGQWSIRVFAYGGEGEVDYTLDVTFG